MKTSSKMTKMIKSIYFCVHACVRWGAKFTNFFESNLGVKQGCLLSPLLFSLFISEVADFVREHGKHGIQLVPGLEEIFLLLFADDIVLVSSTPTGLQNQISNLEKASKALGLTVNIDKTKIMIFRRGGHIAAGEKWYYDNAELEIVNKYKYLGYVLTTRLSIYSACEEPSSKAKGKTLDLMKTMWSLGSFDTTLFFRLFDSQVKPMLLYASEIWGAAEVSVVESAHLFACKRLLNVTDKTPNYMVYGETGRYPLVIDSTVSSVRYWLRLCKMSISRFPKQALTMLQNNLTSCSTGNWVKGIKDCLESFGFRSVWEEGGTESESTFLLSLKKKMIENFKEEWKLKIESSERFQSYQLFKTSHDVEHYLSNITIKKFRDALIRLRLGINELGVNKRFSTSENASVNRNCPSCQDQLENEEHFLIKCPLYSELRHKYLREILNHDNVNPLHHMLHNRGLIESRKTAMYIFYALKLREETLQNSVESSGYINSETH